ncbi:MAG: nucleotidyltransferase domain-containing protein [Desulfamplus sp.]|nr:nucleotidyltransferase domain-containing protein [Desulfamplus sp.]
MDKIKQEIESRLRQIEQDESVHIFYACESGSRAWGFPSADSDYDVRFLYVHDPDWYLSIDDKRDVIERKITDLIDISGWELRKALKLLRKSNPPLLEWLNSPIVYLQLPHIVEQIKLLMPEYYSPKSCMYHYLHMAEGNFRVYLKDEIVWVKKYFYVLRPILACKWIESGYGVVPMEFDKLINELIDDNELKNAVNKLLWRKKEGQELDREPKIAVISDFIESELELLKNKRFNENNNVPNTEKLDELFRWVLNELWL